MKHKYSTTKHVKASRELTLKLRPEVYDALEHYRRQIRQTTGKSPPVNELVNDVLAQLLDYQRIFGDNPRTFRRYFASKPSGRKTQSPRG